MGVRGAAGTRTGSVATTLLTLLLPAALLVGCTPARPVNPTPPPARTVTAANLPDPDELAPPLGNGRVERDDRGGRPVDRLSVCQHPLAELGAGAVVTRSFRDVYPAGDRPFPASALDRRPNTYAAALQFGTADAAARAAATFQGWVTLCRAGSRLPDGSRVLREGFDWTAVDAPPAKASVAEIVYRPRGDRTANRVFESTGVTVRDDRLMLTVHLFYAAESPYSLDLADDEAGFAHPQLGLVQLAALTLGD